MLAERYQTSIEKALLFSIRAGALLVLLMPLIVSDKTLFPFIVGKALYSRALIEIVFGLWLVLAYSQPNHRPPRSSLLVAFGIYLVVGLLAALFGVSIQRSLWSTYERMQGIIDLAHWFALTVVLTSVFRSFLHWRYLLNFNLAVGVVMALLGLAQYFEQYIDVSVPGFRYLRWDGRMDITLGNPTYVGAYMLVNMFIGLGFLAQSLRERVDHAAPPASARRRRRRRRSQTELTISSAAWWGLYWLVQTGVVSWVIWASGKRTEGALYGLAGLAYVAVGRLILRDWWRLFWVTSIILSFWAMWLSATRGALVAWAAGLAVFIVIYVLWGRLRSIRMAALSVAAIMVILGIIIALGRDTAAFERVAASSTMLPQISNIGLDDLSIKGRLTSLSAGLQGAAAKPVLGWGPENFMIAWGRYFDSESGVTERFDQAHNKLVEELTTKGILGLLSYVAIWVLMFRVVLVRARNPDDGGELFNVFLGAAMAGYFVQNLFLFDTPATVLQFILLLGLAATLEASSREEARERSIIPGERSPLMSSEASLQQREPFLGRLKALRLPSGAINRLGTIGAIESLRRVRRHQYGRLVLWAVALLAVYTSIFLLLSSNYRIYEAAKAVVQAENPVPMTLGQRFDLYIRSIDYFEPLANYPRLIMFNRIYHGWKGLGDQGKMAAMALVDIEAQQAIASEPEGWRLYVALSRVYHRASDLSPTYRDRANLYLEAASLLAPRTLEVALIRSQQEIEAGN